MLASSDIPKTETEYYTWLLDFPTSSSKERFDNLRSVYAHMFDDTFALGNGAPETYDECIPILERCIEEKRPYGIVPGAIY